MWWGPCSSIRGGGQCGVSAALSCPWDISPLYLIYTHLMLMGSCLYPYAVHGKVNHRQPTDMQKNNLHLLSPFVFVAMSKIRHTGTWQHGKKIFEYIIWPGYICRQMINIFTKICMRSLGMKKVEDELILAETTGKCKNKQNSTILKG